MDGLCVVRGFILLLFLQTPLGDILSVEENFCCLSVNVGR